MMHARAAVFDAHGLLGPTGVRALSGRRSDGKRKIDRSALQISAARGRDPKAESSEACLKLEIFVYLPAALPQLRSGRGLSLPARLC